MGATETPESQNSNWDAIRDLSPSAKLVAKVLEDNDKLTSREVAKKTLLPERTARHGLTQLKEAGVVTSRLSFMDARKRVYWLDFEEDNY